MKWLRAKKAPTRTPRADHRTRATCVIVTHAIELTVLPLKEFLQNNKMETWRNANTCCTKEMRMGNMHVKVVKAARRQINII